MRGATETMEVFLCGLAQGEGEEGSALYILKTLQWN
jgi:hypothetical protein